MYEFAIAWVGRHGKLITGGFVPDIESIESLCKILNKKQPGTHFVTARRIVH